jgi:nitrogen fixation/metabolism regulation signal transduction histidine kinase
MSPYYRIITALESIKVDDYSVEVIPPYTRGILHKVFAEINQFSQILRRKKRLFDEKDLLVHNLIKQLDSPVLLINSQDQLVHGNQALSRWIGKDWRLTRLMSVKSLGLLKCKLGWSFEDENQAKQFKLRSSHYKNDSGEHQLLIFTDISTELREMQVESWQQVVRVLSHEIKNSLTPIKTIAQALAELNDDPQQKKMLEVINERSQKLSKFVTQYSKLTWVHEIKKQTIDITQLLSSITAIYMDIDFELQLKITQLHAEPLLLEQVLINLITNSRQAIEQKKIKGSIQIYSFNKGNFTLVRIIDNGVGIQNLTNLFVPFYTTKSDGQGIGLLLSRNIIEQHGGQLTLENNHDGAGTTAIIKLPIIGSL